MNLPNKLTVFRILLIPLFMIVLVTNIQDSMTWAAIIFAVASLTDFLDGQIARRKGLVTNFGKFADPLADKLLVMTAMIFLTGLGLVPAWMTSVIVIRELAITGLRTLIVENNGKVLAAELPGKIKTFSQMFAIIFIYMYDFNLGFPIGQGLLWIAIFFTIYSGVDYFWKNRAVFSDGL